MAVLAQIFAATHAGALRRADALDDGHVPEPAPHVDVPSMSALDLEVLGEIAAKAVRFGSGDLEAAEVDLDHEQLLRMPEFWCEVIAEIGIAEDPELPSEVAADWSAAEDVSGSGNLLLLLLDVVALVTAARSNGLDVYLWVEAD